MTLGTIFKGATGLLSFSRGLDVLSNNVGNLNTPGFKRSDVLFRELFYQYELTGDNGRESSNSQLGNGVTTRGTLVSFAQGEVQETGNSTDVAVNGNGFFVLRNEDSTFYTRAGQFVFDDDGFLVSSTLDARVAGLNQQGNLVDININDFRNNPAQATTEVTFVNILSTGSTSHEITDVEVIDSLGESHNLTVTFTNNSSTTPRSWLVDVEDEDSNLIADDLEIRFQANGSPEENFNSISFSFEPENANPTEITFFFGEPGSLTGATSFSSGATSNLTVDDQNGIVAGSLLNVNFSSDGSLEVEYTNEQTETGGRLALAWFDQLQTLRQIGNGLFLAPEDISVEIAAPTDNVMGEIIGSSVEISNVDLTQEFTDLIIVQRGFQASSQVVTTANEMIQQLLDLGRSR